MINPLQKYQKLIQALTPTPLHQESSQSAYFFFRNLRILDADLLLGQIEISEARKQVKTLQDKLGLISQEERRKEGMEIQEELENQRNGDSSSSFLLPAVFTCPQPGCAKGFEKESGLHLHGLLVHSTRAARPNQNPRIILLDHYDESVQYKQLQCMDISAYNNGITLNMVSYLPCAIFFNIYCIALMQSQALPVKLVIVGDGAIGKTCILVSYAENKFPKEYEPTVFDNLTTTLKIDNKIINLGLWDTAGQQEFGRLRPLAYPGTDVFLIAFSVIEPSSFTNARKKWYPEIETVVPAAIKIFVGNKVDLREQATRNAKDPKTAPITKETAKAVIENELKCKYVECSALTREGLKEVFETAVRAVMQKKGGSVQRQPQKNEGSNCNCQLI